MAIVYITNLGSGERFIVRNNYLHHAVIGSYFTYLTNLSDHSTALSLPPSAFSELQQQTIYNYLKNTKSIFLLHQTYRMYR